MDSRFHLKVDFSIYGERFEWDCSLNWSDGESGIDDRIVQFFRDSHDKAREKWEAELFERDRANRESAVEARERAELARLQEKYGA